MLDGNVVSEYTAELCWKRGKMEITCDMAHVDTELVTEFLTSSYWAKGISREIVERSLRGSICFSLLDDGRQVGFARVVSDRATFAFLADVFILPDYRGRGLARWLLESVVSHPELQGLRRWMLGTADAHGLYEKFGFEPLKRPEIFMERHDPEIYQRER